MINRLACTLTNYIRSNSDFTNSDDLEKINYAIETILNEAFKIIILLTLFSILGKLRYFNFSMIILLSIRIFSGGLHSKTFLGCLLWTTLLFIATSIVAPIIPKISIGIYYLISLFNLSVIITKSPYPNPYRPIKSKKRRQVLKVLAVFFAIFWTIVLLFFTNDICYLNCGIFTILLQSLQLLYVKKGVFI
ncbi:accessory gene regulator ArgB-like protein [Clostridium tunisiense]|uniref:accessory gene regulator ArgB-like protein n=1 Tax=Clostridium tunisiense TaxID=219748 RepID=UPI000307721B|nr:accessory gene regulator B family protein [Clostridium tunisiense]